MTLASAAPAAVPAPPVASAVHPFAGGNADSGAQFAEQLNAAAGDWHSATTGQNDVPVTATALPSLAGWLQAIAPQMAPPSVHGSRPTARELPAGIDGKPGSRKLPSVGKSADAARKSACATADPMMTVPAPAPVAVPVTPAAQLEMAVAQTAGDDASISESATPAAPVKAAPSRPEVAETVTPIVTAGSGASQQPQEMAFAARVQPVHAVSQSALPAEMASGAAVASASKKIVAAPETVNVPAIATEVSPTLERNAPATSPSPAPATTASHHTEAPAPPTESMPKATAPLKDISLQVNQPGKERVDVRVVQEGNEVHVSVHSGDSSLTSGLRQGLSELQNRLEENGYRSEMWRPGASITPFAAAPQAEASNNHSRGGDQPPSQGGGGSQQESGRRHQNQSHQPRWVEELESSVSGGEKSSGGFHGFSS